MQTHADKFKDKTWKMQVKSKILVPVLETREYKLYDEMIVLFKFSHFKILYESKLGKNWVSSIQGVIF